jgi:hypothetical protein
MLFYHRTYHAEAILGEGFKDAEETYLTTEMYRGAWLSDVPLDCSERAKGDTVLVLDIPEAVIVPFEWVEDGKVYREFLCPAGLLNLYGRPRIHEDVWQGCSEGELRRFIAQAESSGSPAFLRRAQRVREKIPFLIEHGLLGGDEPEVPLERDLPVE